MDLSAYEVWGVIHGIVFGGLFLLAFAGGLAELWRFRPGFLTAEGVREGLGRLRWGTALMAGLSWLAVWSGTYVVYPSYRAPGPTSPKSILLADPGTALWHKLGMEWHEHVAWFAPILATTVAYLVFTYGPALAKKDHIRRAAMVLLIGAFVTAGIAGVLGALIAEATP